MKTFYDEYELVCIKYWIVRIKLGFDVGLNSDEEILEVVKSIDKKISNGLVEILTMENNEDNEKIAIDLNIEELLFLKLFIYPRNDEDEEEE